jgi:hypothetical protein
VARTPGDIVEEFDVPNVAAVAVPGGIGPPGPEVVIVGAGGGDGGVTERGMSEPYGVRLGGDIGGAANIGVAGSAVCEGTLGCVGVIGVASSAAGAAEVGGVVAAAASVTAGGGEAA